MLICADSPDWNETAVDIVIHLGKDAPGLVKYLGE